MKKAYQVEVTCKYPSYNDAGRLIEIIAATAKEAIRKARQQMAREMYYDRHDGALTYKIKKGE